VAIFIPQGRRRAARDAVGKRFGGVEIANGDHEAGSSHRIPP
jgi:hypothetical protein